MIYQGNNLSVTLSDNGIAVLLFDHKSPVNIFDQKTIQSFKEALKSITESEQVKGLLICSAKDSLMMGADIKEFIPTFQKSESELIVWIKSMTDIFDTLEDLPIPSLIAIKGFALGGGCELSLACDYRVGDTSTSIGLPEVKLGIMPGFGGTVRLPRVIGAENAIEWIATGKAHNADAAMKVGLLDAVVAPEHLLESARQTLSEAINGKLDWKAKRSDKLIALHLNETEALMAFSTCKAMVGAQAGKHYIAPKIAVKTIAAASIMDRVGAMALENKNFAMLAKTDGAIAQTGLFLADQLLKAKAKKSVALSVEPIKQAAVIGAGIMGGGIAYQGAYKGVSMIMKDIAADALSLGLSTASSLLVKRVELGRLSPSKMAQVLANITPSLHNESIQEVELVVEAVVEHPKVKAQVLAEVESVVDENTVITSNTSTISIDLLAKNLIRKDKFCGLHFFNPVHKMPLVEVIRGKDTSDEVVHKVVAFASKIGKSPIVVNDCPGFYVNRVLFPYLSAFSQLVAQGVDFHLIDKVMESTFGWPMGPAYLIDVVGIDTAEHCIGVMAQGYPTRMKRNDEDPVSLLYSAGRLGQKNKQGFYDYQKDKKQKLVKAKSEDTKALFSHKYPSEAKDISEEDIIMRLMIPMVNEVVRCIEEGIIGSAAEADMGLIYGLGFPPFRGGPIRFLETMGIAEFIAQADQLAQLGEIYQVTDGLREMAKNKTSYFTLATVTQ